MYIYAYTAYADFPPSVLGLGLYINVASNTAPYNLNKRNRQSKQQLATNNKPNTMPSSIYTYTYGRACTCHK